MLDRQVHDTSVKLENMLRVKEARPEKILDWEDLSDFVEDSECVVYPVQSEHGNAL